MTTIQDIFTIIDNMSDKINQIQSSGVKEKYENDNLELLSLPAKDFFNLTFFLNAQKKASIIEDYIIQKDNGVKVSSKIDKGDYCKNNTTYIELKTSTTNQNSRLNIRQIRPWQEVDYYLCSFINELNIGESKFYLLDKEDMIKEIKLCGKAVHGTKKSNKNNKNIEYGISFPVYNHNNTITRRWDHNYLNTAYYDKIINN